MNDPAELETAQFEDPRIRFELDALDKILDGAEEIILTRPPGTLRAMIEAASARLRDAINACERRALRN